MSPTEPGVDASGIERVGYAFARAVDTGTADLPLPGGGRTGARWGALTRSCRADPDVGRLVEAHADADAILAEVLGERVGPGERWAVWAARVPGVALEATRADDANGECEGLVLDGRKAWCSGATLCTHALVTADLDGRHRLFRVDLRDPGFRAGEPTWAAAGMSGCDTREVEFVFVPAECVGPADSYLNRPGFWHGAIGVAACWLGTVERVVDPLLRRCRRESVAAFDRAALGAVDASLSSACWALESAAREVDADPDDVVAARRRARRVRAIVETTVATVLDEVASATGAAPLATDPRHVRAVADALVYVRQSHGRADLADLGQVAAETMTATVDLVAGATDVDSRGVPEPEWRAWLDGLDAPSLELPADPVVVVAPHPDDEVLGAGGLIARLVDAGRAPVVVVVTDGAGSHPDSPTLTPARLAALRRDEVREAVSLLGAAEAVHLDLPDGGLTGLEGDVLDALSGVVAGAERPAAAPATLVCTWSGDRHPDHEVVGRCCAELARADGRRLLEYPVWTWQWAHPGAAEVPWHRLLRLDLGPAAQLKRRAVEAFGTQIRPLSDDPRDAAILPPHVLERLCRDSEWFLG